MFRIAFDPLLPVYATSSFPDGTVKAGEQFDWRARGLQAIDALAMFRSGLLAHAHALPGSGAAALPSSAAVAFTATPSERVDVEPPPQQRKRRR